MKLDKEKVVESYVGGKSIQAVADIFGTNYGAVYRLLKALRLTRSHKSSIRKYVMNEDYFKKINSQNKAYILGFIMADGSINPEQRAVSIRLHHRDKEVLDFIKSEICPDKPLYIIKEHGWSAKQLFLLLSSVKMMNDLVRLGCVPNKTFKLKFPNIRVKYQSHFIRGYFDGDGCICMSTNNVFSVIGSKCFIKTLQGILMKKCDLSKTKPAIQKGMAVLGYGGDINVLKIANYLYKNSNFKLQRKYMKFEQIWSNRSIGWKRKTIKKLY